MSFEELKKGMKDFEKRFKDQIREEHNLDVEIEWKEPKGKYFETNEIPFTIFINGKSIKMKMKKKT